MRDLAHELAIMGGRLVKGAACINRAVKHRAEGANRSVPLANVIFGFP
jgi:hypothetical protein